MNIFRRQRPRTATDSPRRLSPRPAAHRVDHTPAPAPDQALQRIQLAAEKAREEIADLVKAEHDAIGETIAAAMEEAEVRLRGATEQRIDSEVRRVERTEAKLRRELKRMVKAEIAKLPAAPTNGKVADVPIRARA